MFDLILARVFCKNKFEIKLIKLILNQDINPYFDNFLFDFIFNS